MTFAETLTISYSEEESSRTNRSETPPKKTFHMYQQQLPGKLRDRVGSSNFLPLL